MDEVASQGRAGDAAAVGRVVIPRRQIKRRLDELAAEVAAAYPRGELTMLVVLTGGMVFAAELMRRLAMRVHLAAACVRSYPDGATESCGPELRVPPVGEFAGRDVLIVDDILDTGATLKAVEAAVRCCGPASVRACVLFRKERPDLPRRREADFAGLGVPNVFVVGYGLDHEDRYRNLPDLHEMGRREKKRPATTRKTGDGRSRSRITIAKGNGKETTTSRRGKQPRTMGENP
jgi:hypoxanthine phosphoribosyltransferase